MASVWGGDSPLVAWGQNAWESNTITASLTAPTPITASLGSLTIADMAIGLTGISITGSLGTISHEMAYDLTGISSTGSLGSLTIADMAIGLTGILSTMTIGNMAPTGYTDIGITGSPSYNNIDITRNPSYTDVTIAS